MLLYFPEKPEQPMSILQNLLTVDESEADNIVKMRKSDILTKVDHSDSRGGTPPAPTSSKAQKRRSSENRAAPYTTNCLTNSLAGRADTKVKVTGSARRKVRSKPIVHLIWAYQ